MTDISLPSTPSGTTVRLILCRHGETALNARRVLQGRGVDPPLNELGILQATRLAERLSHAPVDWIISSNLQRAIQTADIVAQRHPETVKRNTFEDLAEISWGELEGTQSPDLSTLHNAWESGHFDFAAKGGETPAFVSQRATRQIVKIIEQARMLPATNHITSVVIVIHGRLLRILLSTLLHRSLWFMSSMAHANANINIVDVVPHSSMHPRLPRLADLTALELNEFADHHLAAPDALPPSTMTPDFIAHIDKSHSRVFSAKTGILCAHWPSPLISCLENDDMGQLNFMEKLAETRDLDIDNTWWVVGSAVNDVLHLDGLNSKVI